MEVLVYSAKPFEIPLLKAANRGVHSISFTSKRLSLETATMAQVFQAVSIFSADDASGKVLEKLDAMGVDYLALRSAGYDNVDKVMAAKRQIKVANVPSYSPNAIAEHAMTLLMAFNRNIIRAQYQTLNQNFLLDHLIGFDLCGKKVGVLGTGKIGSVLVRILYGYDCKILAYDHIESQDLVEKYEVEYVSNQIIADQAEVIFVCLPLTKSTRYFIGLPYLLQLKKQPILVNIGRGAIVDTGAILDALDQEIIKGYATDVYEHEHGLFFYDHSHEQLNDRLFRRLLHHPKVLLTPHQGFATREALQNIAETTLANLNAWNTGKPCVNEIV